jgi:hypothetical protein
VVAKFKIVSDQKVISSILQSEEGGVFKDINRRCVKVQNLAKKNLERSPRRIDTGRLRSDIHVSMGMKGDVIVGRVGFRVYYGLYVHDGTGIYGPRGKLIVPKQAKMLMWKNKSGWHQRKSIKGMKPNPFLRDAVIAARG